MMLASRVEANRAPHEKTRMHRQSGYGQAAMVDEVQAPERTGPGRRPCPRGLREHCQRQVVRPLLAEPRDSRCATARIPGSGRRARHDPSFSPVARLRGWGPLAPETSWNYSVGALVERGHFTLTADLFRVDLQGRLAVTGDFTLTAEKVEGSSPRRARWKDCARNRRTEARGAVGEDPIALRVPDPRGPAGGFHTRRGRAADPAPDLDGEGGDGAEGSPADPGGAVVGLGSRLHVGNVAEESIDGAVPKVNGRKSHFRALPYRELGDALATVDACPASLAARLCFRFLVLTAAPLMATGNCTFLATENCTLRAGPFRSERRFSR